MVQQQSRPRIFPQGIEVQASPLLPLPLTAHAGLNLCRAGELFCAGRYRERMQALCVTIIEQPDRSLVRAST